MPPATHEINWWAVVPALIFFVSAILPGWTRRTRSADFFLAGSSAGSATVGASLLATVLGASGTAGIVSLGYDIGWGAFWWLGAGAAGLLLLAWIWAPIMRRRPATCTLAGWVGDVYGQPARILAAILIAVMWTAVIAAQWTAAGSVIASLLMWNVWQGIVAVGMLVTAYTVWGGQHAVLHTDRWQLPLIVLAVILALIYAFRLPMTADTAAAGRSFGLLALFEGLTPGSWLAVMVVVGGMYIVGPDLCSRVLVARDTGSARRGALYAGMALVPLSLLITAVGVRIRQCGMSLDSPRDALPWLVNRAGVVPAPLGGLISAGLLAAMVSSADTCLLTAASVLELDLRGGYPTDGSHSTAGRVWVGVVALISIAIAVVNPKIIGNLLLAYAFYAGGLLAPLLATALPPRWRPRRQGWIWTAMTIGGIIPVSLLISGLAADLSLAGLWGVIACAGILLVGTLADRQHP